MEKVVLHHPRKVGKEWKGCETGEGTRIVRCEESEYGYVHGMDFAERDGAPYSEPRATPIMHAWIKENLSLDALDNCTIVFPQCGSAVTEVALLRLILADGVRVRRAIFMDHVMEFIDREQFADLVANTDITDIHLFRRYTHMNEFLKECSNLVMIGVHARMFYGNFPFDDYVEFCRILGASSSSPYVNFRQLSAIEDFGTFTAASGERLIHESGPTVVVKSCSWDDEWKAASLRARPYISA